MSVYKPKNSPYYHYDFQLRGDRFHGSTGERRKRAAEAVEDEERRKARKRSANANRPADVKLDDAAGELYASKAKHQSSAETQKYEINQIIRIYGKDTLIAEIDDARIAHGIARRRADPDQRYKPKNHERGFIIPCVSPATVNRETKMLRRIIKRAARVMRAKQPPEHLRPDWSMHMLAEADPPDQPLTVAQETRLFDELVGHIIPIVDVALLTGLRLSEVMTLNCKNIDFSEMHAGVWRKSKKHGKEWFKFDITEPLLAILAPHVAGRTDGRVWRFGPHCDCRVCALKKNHGRTILSIRTGFKAACRRADIPEFRFHDLRHTVGSRAMALTNNLKAAKDTLGHKSLTTTIRYAHHAPNALADLQRDLAKMRPERRKRDDKSRNNPEVSTVTDEKSNDIKRQA